MISSKQKWEETQLYRYVRRQTMKISHEIIWTWLCKENLKREIEQLLISAQNNIIKTNYSKVKTDKTQKNSKLQAAWGER